MFVIKYKKIFVTISAVLVLLSVVSVSVWGLDLGIDFKGGSILEISYPSGRPEVADVQRGVDELGIGQVSLQSTGDDGYIIRAKDLKEPERESLMSVLSFNGQIQVEEKRFSSIGPVIGEELRQKAWIAIVSVIIAIILFIAFAFRKVSKPVSSWRYGFVAIIALVHDIAIPTGVFAYLGHSFGVEVDTLFVMALLAILGFSVNDTIVVFDRIRENLNINKESHKKSEFENVVGKSLGQTFARSINTSLTTLVVLLVLFFLGGETTKFFALTLSIGVIAGTYSSIFLASPMLVYIEKWQGKNK